MDLHLTVRTVDDETIIDCSGRIVDGAEATALRQVVKRLIAQGTKRIALNLAGVRYIDSGGLGVLAGLHTSAMHTGSHLRHRKLPSCSASPEQIALIGDWGTKSEAGGEGFSLSVAACLQLIFGAALWL